MSRNFIHTQSIVACILGALSAPPSMANERANQLLGRFDANKDGQISRSEWMGPPAKFRQMDANRDDVITREELDAFFDADGEAASAAKAASAEARPEDAHADSGIVNRIDEAQIRNRHKAAFLNPKVGNDVLNAAGIDVSGLVAEFQPEDRCYSIDHVYGELWQGPVVTLHSGADIPAPMNEPILAIADGVLIHKSEGEEGTRKARGISVTLQHSPKDTGLPIWVYTTYTHFNKMPEAEVGKRFKMGEPIGPNGRSGLTGSRVAHLHLTVNIGPSASYAIARDTVVPNMATYIEPIALFRKKLPMDTAAMKQLSGSEQRVPISYLKKSGAPYPADTKLVWPFKCS